MTANPEQVLRAYWTLGPGTVPLAPQATEPTLSEGARAALHDAWMFLWLPLAAGVVAAPLGMLIAWAAMLLGLLR